MTRIKAVKQKAILDVAESLGYSFRRLSGQIYEHPDHDSSIPTIQGTTTSENN